jgi:hypothetical protein
MKNFKFTALFAATAIALGVSASAQAADDRYVIQVDESKKVVQLIVDNFSLCAWHSLVCWVHPTVPESACLERQKYRPRPERRQITHSFRKLSDAATRSTDSVYGRWWL